MALQVYVYRLEYSRTLKNTVEAYRMLQLCVAYINSASLFPVPYGYSIRACISHDAFGYSTIVIVETNKRSTRDTLSDARAQ